MGKSFPAMLPEHMEFIRAQHIFFVGTAPLEANGHVNISPKGYDVFRIISPSQVAYLDLTGSGNETSAHLDENERITFLFTAFEGAPMILRLYGKGRTLLPDSPEWDAYAHHFSLLPGTRQIILADIHEVKTSCGYAVPFFSYNGERETLQKWAVSKGEEGLRNYHIEKNSYSMDGHLTPIGQKNNPS
ncbi:MAG TPA: pyridoxamine 5'-phosphate oxidase family protein [Candidatus Bathyarchaeia archaeon]|nr:pyridoxamine 5'-phosphate oxidase family protein [Candidatus Bathyarchaeia archaeon]